VTLSDVSIGSLRLSARDCGWLADSHSNICFYMSCADGNTGDALALKERLAGHATVLASARRHAGDAHLPHVDYLARNCKADELVFLAFAMLEGPLCVRGRLGRGGGQSHPLHHAGQARGHGNLRPERAGALRAARRPAHHGRPAARRRDSGRPAAPRIRSRTSPSPPPRVPVSAAADARTRALPPRLERTRPTPPAPPPRQPGLHVDFDGGSRGNPGVGGAGLRLVLVRDIVCTVLATHAAFLQEWLTTNNVAEFSGLIGGLELARDFLAKRGPGVGLVGHRARRLTAGHRPRAGPHRG
jgi:hypothetical protein